ncbi:MAG: hypothetical protein R3C68_08045 [Myxococcota bacterium]
MTANGAMDGSDVVPGQINKGLNFDGSNDYVITPNLQTQFSSGQSP